MEELSNKKSIIEIDRVVKKNINVPQQIFGFVIYFLIFAVFIPTVCYKLKFFKFLESYLPNLDLVANLLCWYSGNTGLWSDLYSTTALSLYGFLSQSFVNYLALLGVTYNLAKNSNKSKNMFVAWSPAFVMLLVTYLLPSGFIRHFMNMVEKETNNHIIGLLSGMLASVTIVMFESFLINKTRKSLLTLSEKVINFPNLF